MPKKRQSRSRKKHKGKQRNWTTRVAVVAIAVLFWKLYISAHQSPKVVTIPRNIAPIIQEASTTYKVPKSLVEAVVAQESAMNPNAVSRAGAMGLMQLMPNTAHSLGVTNPFNPTENVMGGTKYLSQLLHRYHGDEKLALAAYNAGPTVVDKYKGIPPYSETEHYVLSVLQYEAQYDKPK